MSSNEGISLILVGLWQKEAEQKSQFGFEDDIEISSKEYKFTEERIVDNFSCG
jgi:hypothetical protein